MAYNILIIGGDASQRDLLAHNLSNKLSYSVLHATNIAAAIALFKSPNASAIDLILFDPAHEYNATDSITVLRKVIPEYTPIIVVVSYGDYDNALLLLGAGAQDFLTKPIALERMGVTLRNALQLRDAWRDAQWLRAGNSNSSAAMPLSFVAEDGNVRRIAQIEAEAIRFAIHYYNGCMTEVAQRLGIGRSTLYRKLHDLSIPRMARSQQVA